MRSARGSVGPPEEQQSLGRLGAGPLQVEVPEEGNTVAVGGLAGDGHGAKPRAWMTVSGDLERHGDVLGLFGANYRVESFDHKARVVHLEVQENRCN